MMRGPRLSVFSMSLFLLIVSLSGAVTFGQDGSSSGWTPELGMKVKGVGSVRVSPDGRKVVYTVSQAVITSDKSEFVTQIWTANTDGADPLQLTFAEKSSDNPQWSPDGRMIAFTSSRSGKSNLYVIRLVGGEAEQVTDVKTAVGSFAWSPDGRQIALVMRDAQTDDEEKGAKGKDDSRWVDENVKMNRLYVMDLQKDAAGKREPRKLTGDYNVDADLDWSPDGKSIVFSRTKTPKVDYWPTADLMVVAANGGEAKTLAATSAAESNPHYSPDGKWIAFLVSDDPPRWAGYRRIALLPAGGGTPKLLAETFDAQPNVVNWSGGWQADLFQ